MRAREGQGKRAPGSKTGEDHTCEFPFLFPPTSFEVVFGVGVRAYSVGSFEVWFAVHRTSASLFCLDFDLIIWD